MKWTLVNIEQETDHPYLNFFTLHYRVKMDDGKIEEMNYYMASRHEKKDLVARLKNVSRPDGVLIALYAKDGDEVKFLLTKQFRQPLGRRIVSIPAGLMDPGDQDVFITAKREAREEAGVCITDMELLCPASPTSSGLSDETVAIVLARIDKKGNNALERFEDISSMMVDAKELKAMLDDPSFLFAANVRLICLYLLERFR